MSLTFTDNLILLNAVTDTTTSEIYDASKRYIRSIEYIASSMPAANVSQAILTFLVSNDGTNFVGYNRLITNVTDSITGTDARVAGTTITASANTMLMFSEDYFRYFKATVSLTGPIASVSVNAGGTGYSVSDVLTLDDGSLGTVTVASVSSGVVTSVTLTDVGTGYTTGTHAVTGGGGNNCIISVLIITAGTHSISLQLA